MPDPKTRSSADIDPRFYQLLYEFERRLADKFDEFRTQNKSDTEAAITAAVAPIKVSLDNVTTRLDDAMTKLGEQATRLQDHTNRIHDVQTMLDEDRKKAAVEQVVSKVTTAVVPPSAQAEGGFKWTTSIVVPLVVAVVGGPLSIWVMLQLKMVAAYDTSIPAVASPTPVIAPSSTYAAVKGP